MLRLLTALGGPIFAKELIETSRRTRYFVNRVLYAVALLIVLWLVWENAGYLSHRNPSIANMARFARDIFIALSMTQYVAVWFFVPVFACGLISAEREAQTLDLLLTAQLSDREIVLGKLASRLAIVIQILLSTMPVVCLVGMFGGIELRAVWRTLTSTLLAMAFCGACSIYFSSTSRSPVGALVRTYWWMVACLLGVPTLTVIVLETFHYGPNSGAAFVFYSELLFNPILSFGVALEPRLDNDLRNRLFSWYYWPMYIVPAVTSAVLMWRAVVRLRWDPSGLLALRWIGWLARRFGLAPRQERRVARRAARAARWWGFPVTNPIWLRSRLARVYDREGHIRRIQIVGWIAALGVFLFVGVFDPRELSHRDTPLGFLIPVWIALGLLTTIIGASSIVSDRRRCFFDLVLVTTLTPREIVDGTILAVWQHVRSTWWLAVVLTTMFVFSGALWPHIAFISLVTGTLFGATIIMLGVITSLAAKSLPQALIPAVVLPLATTIGSGVLIGMFDDGSGPVAWILAALALFCTYKWTRRSLSAAAVGAHFIAVHFALVLLATGLSFDGRQQFLPLGLCNPAPMVIGVLTEEHVGNLFVTFRNRPNFDATWFILAYWIAMVVNVVWARRWVIARFDRLTGRVQPRAFAAFHAPAAPAPTAQEAPLETVA